MGILGVLLLLAQSRQLVDVKTTAKLDVKPGCTIRIVRSEGQLNIEAWDRSEIEMTVSRYTYNDHGKDKALDKIQVDARKTGPNEVSITSAIAGRNPLTRAIHHLSSVDIDYRIRVPKDSNLIVQHGSGDILIEGVAGNIEAHAGNAEIVAYLPSPGAYSIHAKAQFGTVMSDYPGAWKHVFPFGASFETKGSAAAKTVNLETGNGGIVIEKTGVPVLTSLR